MTPSRRYSDLKKAVRELRRALLPSRFDPTGTYHSPSRVSLRALSFRVLVHAEIEAYIEDRAMELFEMAWDAWDKSRVPSTTIVALLAYSGVQTSTPPKKLGNNPVKAPPEDIHTPVQKAQSIFRDNHRRNHGVKEENVLALMLPLGISHVELNTMLLADLSSFAQARGEVAHTSSIQVMKFTDPSAELKTAENLVRDLTSLDEIISKAIDAVKRAEAASSIP
jgi:hypothetical protein